MRTLLEEARRELAAADERERGTQARAAAEGDEKARRQHLLEESAKKREDAVKEIETKRKAKLAEAKAQEERRIRRAEVGKVDDPLLALV